MKESITALHRATLIATYIKRFAADSPSSLSLGKDEDEPTFWAYSELADLVHKKPSEAFDVVLGILASTDDENVLNNLAAGPLEELIQFHGPSVIESIEREAFRNPKFIALLQGVWKAGSEEIWRRIETLMAPH
jgi:hypothetical protein